MISLSVQLFMDLPALRGQGCHHHGASGDMERAFWLQHCEAKLCDPCQSLCARRTQDVLRVGMAVGRRLSRHSGSAPQGVVLKGCCGPQELDGGRICGFQDGE